MSQLLTMKVKIKPNRFQLHLLKASSLTYIQTINNLVDEMVCEKKATKKTSAHIAADLPSAVKNQCIRDAKSVFQKAKKHQFIKVPILKKPCILWNNQNYRFDEKHIFVPFFVDGKSKRIGIKALFTDKMLDTLSKAKLGTLRITKKMGKWIAQFSVEVSTKEAKGTAVMGVDLGVKVPAVAVTGSGKTQFFGNGRKNRFIRRKFKKKRKRLGRLKKVNAIKTLKDKEQRWMKDQDHKISRGIVDFAIQNNVSIIKLEKLTKIRQTAKTSRKNASNLHNWSFYRLTLFIAYKAKLAGIKVEYVDPKYTSQTCPNCSKRNKAKDRTYQCPCGFSTHRDRVGAMNLRVAPVADGQSLSA